MSIPLIGVSDSLTNIQPIIAANSKRKRKIYAPLKCSLYSAEGPSVSFYRDSSGSRQSQVRDCYGYLRTLQAGEAAFLGARRVENICRFSELLGYTGAGAWSPVNSATVAPINDSSIPGPDGEQTGWLLTRGALANSLLRSESTTNVLRAVRHTFSIYAKKVSGGTSAMEIRVYVQGSIGTYIDTKIVTLTDSWQRFAITGTPDGTNAYVIGVSPISFASSSAGSCYIAFPQLEEIIGDTNYAPSEYVPRDLNPVRKYWYGAAVDGVQYFDTAKGNIYDSSSGVVTPGTGATLATLKGLLTYPTSLNQIQTSEDFSGYSKSDVSISLTAASAIAPDGLNTATLFDEGTAASTVHNIQVPATITTANGQSHCFSVFAKKPTSNGRDWVRLFVTDRAGTNLSAYFNISTGTIGTVSSNCWAYVETYADGWYRLIFSFSVGTGASEVVPRIYTANADNSVTYTGTNQRVLIWGASFLSSTSNGSRPVSVPYAKTTAGSQTHPGAIALWSDLEGIFEGTSEISTFAEYTPMYLLSQTNKVSYSAGGPYLVCDMPIQNPGASAAVTGAYQWDRTGITIRPPLSGGAANAKFAFDFYQGDVTGAYKWRANTYYAKDSVVVPTDTQPDNANSKKMFIAVVGGTSGSSEPSWNTAFVSTPDTSTNITSDGTVRWQNNWDNGLSGGWEPYNMADYLYSNSFLETIKLAWFISNDNDYFGAFCNGVKFSRITRPVPINPSYGGNLRTKPSKIYLGSLGTSRGIPPDTIPSTIGVSTAELLAVLTAAHMNISIWEGGVDPNFLGYTTLVGLSE